MFYFTSSLRITQKKYNYKRLSEKKIMSKHANLKNVLQNFYEKNKNLGQKEIRDRFLKLGVPDRTLNNWLRLLEQGKTFQRKVATFEGRKSIRSSS